MSKDKNLCSFLLCRFTAHYSRFADSPKSPKQTQSKTQLIDWHAVCHNIPSLFGGQTA